MTKFLQIILFPLAICYGIVTYIRNKLFDLKVLPSRQFQIPLISIGNLSLGGTGKTPHIEYLIRLLAKDIKLATLSRGYGRSSKGFILATKTSDAKNIGDEPMQIKRKFEGIAVAVDEKRSRGIRLLLQNQPEIRCILLDDAFQHRYVKPGLSILLTDYHRLYYEDYIVPSGTLREFRTGAARADIIVVTKTPKIFSPITRRRILEEIKATSNQQVFFSYIKYNSLIPVFPDEDAEIPPKLTCILMFTGIAGDYPLREHLERMCSDLVVMKFRDHHPYSAEDIEKIINRYKDLPTQKKIIVTTEKDAMRLKNPEFRDYFKKLPLFCVPMEIDFHGTDKAKFDEVILNYVKRDTRNR